MNKIEQKCPVCNLPMLIKTSVSGDGKGKQFYVCPNYKTCGQAIPLPEFSDDPVPVNSVQGETKKCPYCAEMVSIDAKVCRYCQRNIDPAVMQAENTKQVANAMSSLGCSLFLIGICILFAFFYFIS